MSLKELSEYLFELFQYDDTVCIHLYDAEYLNVKGKYWLTIHGRYVFEFPRKDVYHLWECIAISAI